MGYISKDIAVISEPKIVTLAGTPNFVQFESKTSNKTFLELSIKVNATTEAAALLALKITDPLGVEHRFKGTKKKESAFGTVFYVSSDTSETAENLRQALLNDKWMSANFNIRIPIVWVDGSPINGSTLLIKGKGAGKEFSMALEAPFNTNDTAYTISWINQSTQNNDSISGEDYTAGIELDVYTDPDVFLGQDDRPIDSNKIGNFLIRLQKTYADAPLWFNLNSLFEQYGGYNKPTKAAGWFNTGTVKVYRFTAKVKSYNSFTFYHSNALFVLNGRAPAADKVDLSEYVYNDNTIKLLSNKPRTSYMRGQKEYLNFIFSDPQRGVEEAEDFRLRVMYRAYSTGGDLLGTEYGQEKRRKDFTVVNSCRLNIDTILDQYPNAGIIRASLVRDNALVSNSMEYTVLPECLHTLRHFTFLNRLGGWDTFNFEAGVKDEIKPKAETFNKTLTPSYKRGDSLETVNSVALANSYTVEGAPVSDLVATWLKELAESRAVFDSAGNYIIIEDFTLSVSEADKNMQKPTIKYRLSE